MLANNETGVLQPVNAVADLCRRHGAWFHCDAVQGPGRLTFSLEDIGCDSLSLSGHKLGAPAGIGALVLAPDRDVAPILRGGGQERGCRAGTENLIGTIGFGVACALVREEGGAEAIRCATLRTRLETQLRDRFPTLVVHGEGVDRLPNTSCLGLPGLEAQRVLMTLDLKGVRVGAGSACSSGSLAPSPVLLAMGLGKVAAKEAIRVSLGWSTTEADVDCFLDAYGAVAERAKV
jgi:cysteine desulfurase